MYLLACPHDALADAAAWAEKLGSGGVEAVIVRDALGADRLLEALDTCRVYLLYTPTTCNSAWLAAEIDFARMLAARRPGLFVARMGPGSDGSDRGGWPMSLAPADLRDPPSAALGDQGLGPKAKLGLPLGLGPLGAADAPWLLGRLPEIIDIVGRLRQTPAWLIEGADGSGKRSLVAAGIVPALRRGWLDDGLTWRPAIFRPGHSPISALARALTRAAGRPEKEWTEIRAQLSRADAELPRLWSLHGPPGTRVALVALSLDGAGWTGEGGEWAQLDGLLAGAVEADDSPCCLLATARLGGLERLGRLPRLHRRLSQCRVRLNPPDGQAVAEIAQGAARLAGVRWGPGLVDRLVDDFLSTGSRWVGLIWLIRRAIELGTGDEITAETYLAAGGVANAVTQAAEATWSALDAGTRDPAERLLLALVCPGRGQPDASAPRTLAELESVVGQGSVVREIVEILSRPGPSGGMPVLQHGRLRDAVAGSDVDGVVELIEDTLIDDWPRLQALIRADRSRLEPGGSERALPKPQIAVGFENIEPRLRRAQALVEHLQWIIERPNTHAPLAVEREIRDLAAVLSHTLSTKPSIPRAEPEPTLKARLASELTRGERATTRGDSRGALQAYEAAERIALTLHEGASTAFAKRGALRHVATSQQQVGEAALTAGDFDTAEQALARAADSDQAWIDGDPNNAVAREHWARTIELMGDLAWSRGALPQAVESYGRSLDLRKALVALYPAAGSRRALSVGFNKLGDALAAGGKLAQAGEAFEAARELRLVLVAERPDSRLRRRDLSVTHERMGDVALGCGRFEDAQRAYREGLAIRRALVADHPEDARLWRDLSVIHERIGDAHMAAGQGARAADAYGEARAIRLDRLAAAPADARRSRDLWAIEHKIGDCAMLSQRLDEARDAYSRALERARSVNEADPSSCRTIRDLASSLHKLGEWGLSAGRLRQAQTAHEHARRLRQGLVARERSHPRALRELATTWARLGDVALAQADTAAGLAAYAEAIAVVTQAVGDRSPNRWEARQLANLHGRQGDAATSAGRLIEASDAYGAARRFLLMFVDEQPGTGRDVVTLASVESRLGDVWVAKGALGEARQWYLRARRRYERVNATGGHDDALTARGLMSVCDRLGDVAAAAHDSVGAREAYGAALAHASKLSAAGAPDPKDPVPSAAHDLLVCHVKMAALSDGAPAGPLIDAARRQLERYARAHAGEVATELLSEMRTTTRQLGEIIARADEPAENQR